MRGAKTEYSGNTLMTTFARLSKTPFVLLVLMIGLSLLAVAQESNKPKKKKQRPTDTPVTLRDSGDISARNLNYGDGTTRLPLMPPFTFVTASDASPSSFVKGASPDKDIKCSVSADNHLLGYDRHRLSWQVDANCGSGTTAMKLTYSVLKDGRVWYGSSQKRNSKGALHVRDTPLCASGTHRYKVVGTLNYYYFNRPKSLGPTYSREITCSGRSR